LIFFFFFSTFLKAGAQSPNVNLGIIPVPESIKITTGHFSLIRGAGITIEYGNSSDRKIAQMFHDFLKQNYALDLPTITKANKKAGKVIRFSSNNYNGDDKEGYKLIVTSSEINVSGENAGLFYGLQTLMQIFSFKEGSSISIPCAEIIDAPRYKYRGMMLDVCLHFYPVSFIKKFLDMMAEYKLNTFHWHLTEDQGWRIEIKRYPLLTTIGAWRKETQIGHDPKMFDGQRYGGFYTQNQIRDVVKYAAERHINIIPEIELPGHSLAALASYSWLGCSGGPYKVATTWGIFKDVYCPTDSTFTFLENVLTEVLALFPSHYIHIGGDEVPKDN
jgi:hexosaminidase